MSPRRIGLAEAVLILRSGGLILMATDTLPGFHCRADCAAAVARIAAIKGRDEGKPLLVLAGSAEQAGLVAGPLTRRQQSLAAACWPGPFSIILPARPGLAAAVTAGGATVAVRVPDRRSVCEVALAAGFPLVSTSVNRAGAEPARDLASAGGLFGESVDGVLFPDDQQAGIDTVGAGPDGPAVASALVDATVWPPIVLRRGPLPLPPIEPQS